MRSKAIIQRLGATDNGLAFLQTAHREEIERAIDNVKRTAWDKWFRRQWYRAGARRRWNSSHRAFW